MIDIQLDDSKVIKKLKAVPRDVLTPAHRMARTRAGKSAISKAGTVIAKETGVKKRTIMGSKKHGIPARIRLFIPRSSKNRPIIEGGRIEFRTSFPIPIRKNFTKVESNLQGKLLRAGRKVRKNKSNVFYAQMPSGLKSAFYRKTSERLPIKEVTYSVPKSANYKARLIIAKNYPKIYRKEVIRQIKRLLAK